MNTDEIEVLNIKCAGCASTVMQALLKMEGISNVEVDISRGLVTVSSEKTKYEDIVKVLASIGYPEKK